MLNFGRAYLKGVFFVVPLHHDYEERNTKREDRRGDAHQRCGDGSTVDAAAASGSD